MDNLDDSRSMNDLDEMLRQALESSPFPAPGLEATLAEADSGNESISTEMQNRLDELGKALVKRFARHSQ